MDPHFEFTDPLSGKSLPITPSSAFRRKTGSRPRGADLPPSRLIGATKNNHPAHIGRADTSCDMSPSASTQSSLAAKANRGLCGNGYPASPLQHVSSSRQRRRASCFEPALGGTSRGNARAQPLRNLLFSPATGRPASGYSRPADMRLKLLLTSSLLCWPRVAGMDWLW